MTTQGIYIYGIVPNFYGTTQFQSLANSGVYAVTYENISAIVSDQERAHLDFTDRESLARTLVHHQQTIEDLMAKGFNMIIPMKLGTIVNSRKEVSDILARGHEIIINTLTKIEYLTEIDLVVTWADFSSLLKGIAELPAIQSIKNDMMKENGIVAMTDQVKMGLIIHDIVNKQNKAIESKIQEALAPFSLDKKLHEVMNDEMVTNAAFLINRNKQADFEHAIDQLDELFSGSLNFKLVGPLPCYSFQTLEVRNLNPEQIIKAGKTLGVKEKTNETEIKKAYLEKAKLHHPDNNSQDTPSNGDFNAIRNAYNTLVEYAAAARQSSKEEFISLAGTSVPEYLTIIKIND